MEKRFIYVKEVLLKQTACDNISSFIFHLSKTVDLTVESSYICKHFKPDIVLKFFTKDGNSFWFSGLFASEGI